MCFLPCSSNRFFDSTNLDWKKSIQICLYFIFKSRIIFSRKHPPWSNLYAYWKHELPDVQQQIKVDEEITNEWRKKNGENKNVKKVIRGWGYRFAVGEGTAVGYYWRSNYSSLQLLSIEPRARVRRGSGERAWAYTRAIEIVIVYTRDYMHAGTWYMCVRQKALPCARSRLACNQKTKVSFDAVPVIRLYGTCVRSLSHANANVSRRSDWSRSTATALPNFFSSRTFFTIIFVL